MLNESPDEAWYNDSNRDIQSVDCRNDDARAFGFLNGKLLVADDRSEYHYRMVLRHGTFGQIRQANLDGYPVDSRNPNPRDSAATPDACPPDSDPYGYGYDGYGGGSGVSGKEDGPRLALRPAGRMWWESGFISFWCIEQAVTPWHINEIAKHVGGDIGDWFIEFRGEYDDVNKRTVSGAVNGRTSSATPDTVARDRELLKIQHLVPAAKKTLAGMPGSKVLAGRAQAAGYPVTAAYTVARHMESWRRGRLIVTPEQFYNSL